MNLFQTLVEVSELCNDGVLITTLVSIVKTIFTIIQFGVPAVLIILCAIDMFKAMTNGDEKEVKKAQQTAIRRLIYALVIFLIIPIITLILNTVNSVVNVDGVGDAKNTWNTFLACWGYSGSNKGGSSSSNGQCYDPNGNPSSLNEEKCNQLFSDGYYWDEK